jgi:hypothetical protein
VQNDLTNKKTERNKTRHRRRVVRCRETDVDVVERLSGRERKSPMTRAENMQEPVPDSLGHPHVCNLNNSATYIRATQYHSSPWAGDNESYLLRENQSL